MSSLFNWLDPQRKGPLFWHYGWKGWVCIALGTWAIYAWITGPHSCPLAGVLYLFTIGVHEAGHPVFRFLSGGNFVMTILGGTLMELGVPILAFCSFLHRKHELQADVCILLLAIACYSVGHYAGCSLDPVITLLNGGPETVPDWDYMHRWFGTQGHEGLIRQAFYMLSAFLTALGSYLFITHFWEWTNPENPSLSQEEDEYGSFFTRR